MLIIRGYRILESIVLTAIFYQLIRSQVICNTSNTLDNTVSNCFLLIRRKLCHEVRYTRRQEEDRHMRCNMICIFQSSTLSISQIRRCTSHNSSTFFISQTRIYMWHKLIGNTEYTKNISNGEELFAICLAIPIVHKSCNRVDIWLISRACFQRIITSRLICHIGCRRLSGFSGSRRKSCTRQLIGIVQISLIYHFIAHINY